MKTGCLRGLLWAGLLPCALNAQTLQHETNKIVIEENGIYPISKSVFDKIAVNPQTNAVLHPYPDSARSIWYKIYVAADCRITFEIFASDPGNRYNYFLYQQQGDLNVEEVYAENILPVRANLFNERMKIGTGLSYASKVSITDSCPRNLTEIFYRTPYHAPVIAKAGDVLLLNVYHLRGTDCGHHFVLKSNNDSQEFHSIYARCYKEEEVIKNEGRPFKPGPLFARRQKGPSKGLFMVFDSLRQSTLDVQVACAKECNTVNTTSTSAIKDSFEVILEKNTAYQITFSSFGYQNKTVQFTTQDSLSHFRQDIRLSLIKEGDGFVMDKIYFYPNTYAMKPGSLSQINQLAAHLNANPDIKIEIQGHTNGDKRIKRSYTKKEDGVLVSEGRFKGSAKKLSHYRSQLIKKQLVEKGVDQDRLVANGYGGSKMIHAYPKDQEEANKNIRVGVLVLSQDEKTAVANTTGK